MSVPKLYTQVERMVENTALQTKTARAIVRKAGLRPVVGDSLVVPGHSHTLVSTFIVPADNEEGWQWLVDLTGFSRISLYNPADRLITLFYSTAGATSSALDPGDYQAFRATLIRTGQTDKTITENSSSQFGPFAQNRVNWYEIPQAQRVPLRLSISAFPHPLDPEEGEAWSLPLESFNFANREGFGIHVGVS